MIDVQKTDVFETWLEELRDKKARSHVLKRIDRLSLGNAGDVEAVGHGVSEMRIHYGPGYRVYFVNRGRSVVLLLCGGDKRSQRRDIRRAIKMAQEV